MPVEFYKTKKGYYYRDGPRGAKRISKEEWDEATKGKPIRRSAFEKKGKPKSKPKSKLRR
jgi:hypothetical protein